MDTHTTDRTPPQARAVRPDCCADEKCSSGSRNNYFLGKRLTPDTFRAEQKYLVERRHLLNRAIHGWGVVYGFPVAMQAPDACCTGAELGYLEIGEGLALDRIGRELVQTEFIKLKLESVTLLDGKNVPIRADSCNGESWTTQLNPDAKDCWLLKVHYAEQSTAPVMLKDSCNYERKEWDQVCETVRYTLKRVDCGECCVDQGCELQCHCSAGPCCEDPNSVRDKLQSEYEKLRQDCDSQLRQFEEHGMAEQEIHKFRLETEAKLRSLLDQIPPQNAHVANRGGCRCLCDHLSDLQLGSECHSLCAVDECARADLHNGIALACVKLDQDECGNWRFASVFDACGPRRLVKRNDLLFDLINGCDVTRITEIGWKEWHRRETPISFDEFSKALGEEGEDESEYVTNDFWVKFSRPVRKDTLRPDCFVMTIMGTEDEGGWWQPLRVPIVGVDSSEFSVKTDNPGEHVLGTRIVVSGKWLEDAVRGSASIFLDGPTRIELEVRGDFIIDCNGQAVDGNAHGLSALPSGNNAPGDSFLSTFTVEKRPEIPRRAPKFHELPVGAKS